MAQNNATIAKQNADAATQAGQAQAEQASLKASENYARVAGAFAANGIDVNSGSAVDVETSQREAGKLDTENVLHNAQLTAYGYRTQSTNFEAQSELDKQAADQAPIGAAFNAAGGLLSSASSLGFKWGGGGSTSTGGSGGIGSM